MQKIIPKIDNWIFKKLSDHVIKYVQKNKYAKHKYDFFVNTKGWEIAYWVGALLFVMGRFILRHIIVGVVVDGIFLAILLVVNYFDYQVTLVAKERYDILWVHRKNPAVYNVVKETCQVLWEETTQIRRRVLTLNLTFFILMVFWNPILAPVYLFIIAKPYINYIFDFDEPDKKEKAKESISEVLLRSWQNLIGNINPKGI